MMLDISCTEDIAALRESSEVECKLAQGRDGKGALPKDFWETYSAFANTSGGNIFLGLKELHDRRFELAGIENIQKVQEELWNNLNNPQKVSCNLIKEKWVKVISIDGKNIIHVHVPAATRRQKPLYINGNPLKGTYKRLNSADMLLAEEAVRRLLAEQVEDSRDTEILKGYEIDDIDAASFNTYRQMYNILQPDHPWNQVNAKEFLTNIGAFRKDRETGISGLTRAGLLMFGKLPAIQEAFPNYMLDYQERPEAKAEHRWIDRLTLDGSWSGNLFDFYRQVIRKLTADIKIPFALKGDQRQDDTPVHKALREALVNALVHADYTGRASVLVVKRPDMFGFRNPGQMRIPPEIALKGSESDCRNRLLHQMFRYIGLGEQAGSGLPRIIQGWKEQHWREPVLQEKSAPSEQTLLSLHMLSLVPEKVIQELRESLGAIFDTLSEPERLILVTAQIETTVDHVRMMQILDIHPRDLTRLFAGLCEKGLIYQDGTGRGTIYFLADARIEDAMAEFAHAHPEAVPSNVRGPEVMQRGPEVRSGGLEALTSIAAPVATSKKAPRELLEEVILKLCAVQPLTLEELVALLNRSGEFLRKEHLQRLVRGRKLRLRYPTKPNHPDQAYITET